MAIPSVADSLATKRKSLVATELTLFSGIFSSQLRETITAAKIKQMLHASPGAWFKDTALRAQLDHLCKIARVQRARQAQKCDSNQHDGSEG